jgi:ubiquinone/menaquinone biosynthesis C-methylase UbiE
MSIALPYSQLAAHYDEFVGLAQFRQVRRIFDHCVRAHGLRFSRAADFGCGTGLLAQYLASHWRALVYAIDRSPQMLDIARRRCKGLRCRFLMSDFRDLSLPQPVDLITMFSSTLNLVESARVLAHVVDSVWRNLEPGGYWILDFLTPRLSAAFPPQSERSLNLKAGNFCLRICIGRPAQGGRHEELHCARLLAPLELRDQLDRRGFVLVDALAPAPLGPPQHASPSLVFVVRKPVRQAC